jgi:hypothetical protein
MFRSVSLHQSFWCGSQVGVGDAQNLGRRGDLSFHSGLQTRRINFKLLGSVEVTLHYNQPAFDTSRADPLLGKIL